MSLLLSQNQIPLLIALLAALLVVGSLIVRQLGRSGAASDAPPATSTPTHRSVATGGASHAAPQSMQTHAIQSWGYQLQKLDLARAAASPFDLLVIDTTRDGSDETALEPADLAILQKKPGGARRRVLAYLSIGEAESYRAYWDPQWKRARPDWLLGENPDWKENYAVCYWRPEWQQIMCGSPEARLDRILAAGFDGVYLDKCDVYDDLRRRHKAAAASRPDLEADMVAFIARLSAHAKSQRPDFMVVMQNAEDLLARPDLRAALDGVAKEELLFGGERPERPNAPDESAASRTLLDLIAAEGKPVLVVEYLDAEGPIRHAVEALQPLGYVLYVARKNRKLDELVYSMMSA